MEDTLTEQNQAGGGRDEQGRWIPGVSGNPEGAKPWTEEQKIAKKARKELIAIYQDKLAEALEKIEPVLIAKALAGDVPAIKEVHDRAMGKAPQTTDITSDGKAIMGNAIVFKSFSDEADSQ